MPNVSEVFGESIQQSGAVAPALHARANAHFLKEEVVVGSRTFQMTNREAEQFSVGIPRTDTVGAGSSEEVAEPLSSILRVPRLVPRRCIEGLDVEGDTSAKRFARQSGDHAEPWHGARTGRIRSSADVCVQELWLHGASPCCAEHGCALAIR